MRASILTWALGIALLGGVAGCSSYHYFDIDVKLDTTLGSNGTSSRIQLCNLTIKNEKGGIEDDFPLTRKNASDVLCPVSGSTIGTFEYSTFKDSGSLTFTVAAYNMLNSVDETCKMGEGSVTVEVKDTTNAGTLTVNAINAGAGCP
jgi:hypothetical protein